MSKNLIKHNGKTVGKVLNVILTIALYLIICIALFVLIISIVSKKDSDGTATVFGYQIRFVKTNSMEECDLTDVSEYDVKSIKVKSCIFIKVLPQAEEEKALWYKNLKVGDVLTFKYVYTKQETITHRIVDIKEKESGGYIITLEGDNKNAETNLLQQTIDTSLEDSPNYVIGKVTGQSYVLGVLVYAFKTPIGIVFLIIIPCFVIITFEILKLVNIFSKEKKLKIEEEKKMQEDEIEKLKRQIEELQSSNKDFN